MNNTADLVIIGGGITGILLALKLSLSPQYINKSLIIIDEQPTLGGRLFFSSPRSFLGKNRAQIQEELLQDAHDNKSLSGFGFELFDIQTKESLFRHIQNSLTEEENVLLEEMLSQFVDKSENCEQNVCYAVKKEFTPVSLLLKGSSELLTKKESEILKSLIEEGEILDQNGKSKAESIWNELSKAAKESLSQIFETIVGLKWESMPFKESCKLLNHFFLPEKKNYFLAFKREVALEIFLEKILINRGFKVRNLCKLIRLEQNKDSTFSLILNDEIEPQEKQLCAKKLILAVPLSKCAGVLPKEIYSPEQSKFVSRIQPLSLVVYEISHFADLQSATFTLNLNAYDKLIFPVEKVKAFYAADNRMLFYTELDYEDSMQAPAVREAVGRLKRAAGRVLNEDTIKEMKKGMRIPQNSLSERVILLPVAESIPHFAKINFELNQVKMGVSNLYCCGDSIFSLADEPWKRVIHSVQDVAHFLS